MKAPCIAVAGVVHETNSFSRHPTTLEDFENCSFTRGILHGDALATFLTSAPSASGGFYRGALARGYRPVPVLYAFAEPAGPVCDAAFDTIVSDLIAQLDAVPRWDGVFLELHGAMISESHEEADAELVRRVRNAVGPSVPVVASFDLHGNVTPRTLAQLNAAAAFRTYPHVDMAATGERVLNLLERLLNGEELGLAYRPVPFLMPLNRQSHLEEPCRSLYRSLETIERNAGSRISLNLMLGFPLGDALNAGPSVFAHAPSLTEADAATEALLAEVLQREQQFGTSLCTAEDAARQAKAWTGPKPLLIADVQDNAGGGATSDTVEIIDALIREEVADAIVGMVHDPESAQAAHTAGVGQTITLHLGGKLMPGHTPLTAAFVVEALCDRPFKLFGPIARGLSMDLGKSALIRCKGVRIVVTTGRTQCLDSGFFRQFGLVPESHSVIVVKSANHYRADFQPMVGRIVEAQSAGACVMDPASIPYRRLRRGVRLGAIERS